MHRGRAEVLCFARRSPTAQCPYACARSASLVACRRGCCRGRAFWWRGQERRRQAGLPGRATS
eukprot:10381106-Alexandrium_andersonii.AAC.1